MGNIKTLDAEKKNRIFFFFKMSNVTSIVVLTLKLSLNVSKNVVIVTAGFSEWLNNGNAPVTLSRMREN